jgi:hypothetical protein
MDNKQLQIFIPTAWVDKNWSDIKRGDLYRYADEPEKVFYALDVTKDGKYVWAKELIDPREKIEHPIYCCKKCGECIGYLGIFLNLITFNKWHKCISIIKEDKSLKPRTYGDLEKEFVHTNQRPKTNPPIMEKYKNSPGRSVCIGEYHEPRAFKDLKNLLNKLR